VGRRAEAAAAGLADAEVKERMADAIAKTRHAEAVAEREIALAQADGLREKLKAEAEGLTEKAGAMARLDEASREHEEYRLRLEAEKEIRVAGIDVQRQIAEAQATLIATGLENANIDIVGGDSVFFDRLIGSIAAGRSVDAFVNRSETVQAMAGPWLDKEASTFTGDLTAVAAGLGAGGLRDLTLAGLLTKLAAAGGPAAPELSSLLDAVRGSGVADLPLSALAGGGAGRAHAAANGAPAVR
jgi:hypothetical protein